MRGTTAGTGDLRPDVVPTWPSWDAAKIKGDFKPWLPKRHVCTECITHNRCKNMISRNNIMNGYICMCMKLSMYVSIFKKKRRKVTYYKTIKLALSFNLVSLKWYLRSTKGSCIARKVSFMTSWRYEVVKQCNFMDIYNPTSTIEYVKVSRLSMQLYAIFITLTHLPQI